MKKQVEDWALLADKDLYAAEILCVMPDLQLGSCEY